MVIKCQAPLVSCWCQHWSLYRYCRYLRHSHSSVPSLWSHTKAATLQRIWAPRLSPTLWFRPCQWKWWCIWRRFIRRESTGQRLRNFSKRLWHHAAWIALRRMVQPVIMSWRLARKQRDQTSLQVYTGLEFSVTHKVMSHVVLVFAQASVMEPSGFSTKIGPCTILKKERMIQI